MPIYEHSQVSHLGNSQLSSWLNVMPPIESKHVVIIGTKNVEIINALIRCNLKSLTYIGTKHFNIDESTINYVDDFNSLSNNRFDFCIVDDIECFSKLSCGSLQTKLKKCFSLLNGKGIFLIGMRGGLKNFVAKLIIRKKIKKIGFKHIRSFICEPSFETPIFIYPFSQAPKHTKKILTEGLFKKKKIKNIIYDIIKFFIFRLTVYNNPLTGTFITSAKDGKNNEDENLLHIINKNNRSALIKENDIYTIWLSKPYWAKHVGLIFKLCNKKKKLLAVCKQTNKNNHRASVIKDEYKTLSLLFSYHETLNKENIVVPQPIYFECHNERIKSLESAVQGIPISNSGIPVSTSQIQMPTNLLNKDNILIELVSKQIFIQDLLTKKMKDKLPIVNAKYFENTQSFVNEYFNNYTRLDFYKKFTQHGDYTMVNFLYDINGKKWGIIDWEWLATGYPPLFDLFYLFTSVRFREKRGQKYRMFENDFQSFIETFFKKNQFSEFVYGHILHYCSYFQIERKQIYNYFLDYLLFNYNKFRLDFNLPQFETLYKDMIIFSLKNEDRFLSKIN